MSHGHDHTPPRLPTPLSDADTLHRLGPGEAMVTVPGYRLRPATEHDQAAMTDVRRRAWHLAYDDIWGPGPIEQMFKGELAMSWENSEPDWSETPRTNVAVAQTDAAVVGLLSYGIRRECIGEVRMLYVDPEHHARGVATMLWNDALRAMLDAGSNQVAVWVLGRNQPARVWYEHRGLTQFGESLVRLGDQDEVETGYRMVL